MSMFALRVGYQIIILRRRSGLNLDIDSHDVGVGTPYDEMLQKDELEHIEKRMFFYFLLPSIWFKRFWCSSNWFFHS